MPYIHESCSLIPSLHIVLAKRTGSKERFSKVSSTDFNRPRELASRLFSVNKRRSNPHFDDFEISVDK